MTIIELLEAFADEAPVAVLATDAVLAAPGPRVVYANAAFETMTGHEPRAILGLSPRFMQGRETRRPVLDVFGSALAAGRRFHGYLTNYRRDGSRYVVEIDCRPIREDAGPISHYLAFQREVNRRRGRPAGKSYARYEPVTVQDEALPPRLRNFGVFAGEARDADGREDEA
jgi:PAS domain S-box-containing protein